MEEKREEEKVDIKNASDTEWHRLSLMSIGGWIIKESESGKEVLSCLEYDKRREYRREEKESELFKNRK